MRRCSILTCAILRAVAIATLDNSNPSATGTNDAVWSTLECSLAIVNACLPIMQPALNKILVKTGLATTDNSTKPFTGYGAGKSTGKRYGKSLGSARTPTDILVSIDGQTRFNGTDAWERLDDEEMQKANANKSYDMGQNVTVEIVPLSLDYMNRVVNGRTTDADPTEPGIRVTKDWNVRYTQPVRN